MNSSAEPPDATLTNMLAQISAIAQDWQTYYQSQRVLKRTSKLEGEKIITAVRQLLIINDTPSERADLIYLQQLLESLTAIVAARAAHDDTSIATWLVRGTVVFKTTRLPITLIIAAQTAATAATRALDMTQRHYHLDGSPTWIDEPIIESADTLPE